MATRPPLTALYVPGDRPDRFDKAVGSGADIVIIDLEDAVAPGHKDEAREAAFRFLLKAPPCPVAVRINGAETPWHTLDLETLGASKHLSGIHLPKVETPTQVENLADRFRQQPIHAIIESAPGIENLFAIVHSKGVASIGLGEADLRSDLSITDPNGLDWIQARVVVAARAANLPPPRMSVWTALHDLTGLAESCRHGKARGFLGRAAIHPKQIDVIRKAFTPTAAEIAHAREVLAALDDAERSSSGVALLSDRHMVDAAMRRGAQQTVALAELADTAG